MPRSARIVLPGLPHHLTHRGNLRSPIFFSNRDRERYLHQLDEYAHQEELDLWAYCLMDNHIHLLAVPKRADSLARAIGKAHGMYSRWMNSRRNVTGHIWANRFYSSPVEPDHAPLVARYIELNPVRAGIVDRPETYRWSSARAHCTGGRDPHLSERGHRLADPDSWGAWLAAGINDDGAERIRASVNAGLPFGSKRFVAELEHRLGCRLTRRRYRKPSESL